MYKSRAIAFEDMPIDQIECDLTHPRLAIPGLTPVAGTWLLASIEEYGVLQNLVVNRRADGRYRIIDGQRRFLCAKKLGLTTLPCNVHVGLDNGDVAVLRFQLQSTFKPWTHGDRAAAMRSALRRARFPEA